MLEEYFFACPYCWEQISMMLDSSSGGQRYVEDCENCCNPINVSYEVEDGSVMSFVADSLEQ